MAAMAYLIMAIPLLLQRKEGQRSRTILGVLVLVSVFNYSLRISSVLYGEIPALVVSVPMLLLALFMVTSYILYPIEVIAPGWLKPKRIVLLYSHILIFALIWYVSLKLGVVYEPYHSLVEMLPDIWRFSVWYRLLLAFMMFLPLISIFFVRYKGKYSNTDNEWIRGYVIVFFINTLGYIAVLAYDSIYIATGYYYISVGCELYIVYKELFVRIIKRSGEEVLPPISENQKHVDILARSDKNSALFERLDHYIQQGMLWHDPDLSMDALVKQLYTNRTTLSIAIKEHGYDNYSDYINQLRVNEFISLISSGKDKSFLDCFFDVGFRSKSSAFRNFRKVTGMTPSEYFK